MALGTAVLAASSGSLRASFTQRVTIPGDDAYPTGGTLEFAATYLVAAMGVTPTIKSVQGYGLTSGAITHFVRYDAANDALIVYLLSTGAQVADTTDLSGVSFDLTVNYV